MQIQVSADAWISNDSCILPAVVCCAPIVGVLCLLARRQLEKSIQQSVCPPDVFLLLTRSSPSLSFARSFLLLFMQAYFCFSRRLLVLTLSLVCNSDLLRSLLLAVDGLTDMSNLSFLSIVILSFRH